MHLSRSAYKRRDIRNVRKKKNEAEFFLTFGTSIGRVMMMMVVVEVVMVVMSLLSTTAAIEGM